MSEFVAEGLSLLFGKSNEPVIIDLRREKQIASEGEISIDVDTCADCDQKMVIMDVGEGMKMVCENCGIMEECVKFDRDRVSAEGLSVQGGSYNTYNNSAAPLKIVGPGAYCYQRKLLGDTSTSRRQQRKNTRDEMKKIIFQYKGDKPPKNVIHAAADMYYDLQQHHIKRGDVRLGTMAACVYQACIEHDIIRKPTEIADMFGVPQTALSEGAKILDDLAAKGMIHFSNRNKFADIDYRVKSFINRYFESLGITTDTDASDKSNVCNYRLFVVRIIEFTIAKHIAESSVISSKCAGAVYILSQCCPKLEITCEKIQKECKISKSTFVRFAKSVKAVLNYDGDRPRFIRRRKQLQHIHKKFGIDYDY